METGWSGPHVWHTVYVRPLGFTVQSGREAAGAQCLPAEPTAGGSHAGTQEAAHTKPESWARKPHFPTEGARKQASPWVHPKQACPFCQLGLTLSFPPDISFCPPKRVWRKQNVWNAESTESKNMKSQGIGLL